MFQYPLYAVVSTAASGATTLVSAPTNSSSICVVEYVLIASAAVTVKFQSGATDLTGAMALAANGGLVVVGRTDQPLLMCAPNAALNINLGGAVQVSGHIAYTYF